MRREEKPIDCLFIGGSTQDLMMRVEQMPGSDQRVQASEYVQCCGGVSATAAAAHQSLGGVTGMITIVGEDEAGTFIRQDLAKQRFRAVQMIETSHSRSSVSMILVDRDGSRSITHYGGCIYDLEFEMLDKNLLKSAKVIHLGVMGEKLMVDLAKFCREEGEVLLSIDGGNLPRKLADQLLPYTDIWILDEATTEKTLDLDAEEACRYYASRGKQGMFTAVTRGEKGAVGFDGESFLYMESIDVPVVDTTGAGDNYHGAFLYALGQGWELKKCMEFAGVFASLTCGQIGGRKGIPALEEVINRIA